MSRKVNQKVSPANVGDCLRTSKYGPNAFEPALWGFCALTSSQQLYTGYRQVCVPEPLRPLTIWSIP